MSLNDWMFSDYDRYQHQLEHDRLLAKMLRSQPPPPPSIPSQADMLRSLEWTEQEQFDTTHGVLNISKCKHCGGLCDKEGVVHGNAEILRKALPPKWKGHKQGCVFLAEILPRIAELELGGE